MRMNDRHLCYSLNVYPGNSWIEKLECIKEKLLIIRRGVGAKEEFAIGLWLDHLSVNYLKQKENLRSFQRYLRENHYYVFTINAFPYGEFHAKRVKEQVYLPDWTSQNRVSYTLDIAEILAEILPEGVSGSISTVPGSYKSFIQEKAQEEEIAKNLLKVAKHLQSIEKSTGKRIELAIEMEPDCLWESPQEFALFYQEYIEKEDFFKYIGVCYDTCHQELTGNLPGQGIEILQNDQIPISKIQLSACIKAPCKLQQGLNIFQDDVYLHQTRTFQGDKLIDSFQDLPQAMEKADRNEDWKIHYHVPYLLR